jgi:hypothetical protein
MKDREPRVDLCLASQAQWFWFPVAMHAAALAAVWLAGFGWAASLVLSAAVASSLAIQLATHWRRIMPRSIRAVTWYGDGRWEITDNRATLAGSLVSYYLGSRVIILKFRFHPAVLLWRAEKLSSAERRLRVRLRHGRISLDQTPRLRWRKPGSGGAVTMRGNL